MLSIFPKTAHLKLITMKVALNLTLQNLGVLIYCYDTAANLHQPKSRESKVARSVLDKTIIRFKKKQAEASYEPTLFTKKNKKFKIALEIYEAHFLEQFVLFAESTPLSDYDRNVLGYVKSNINQQLA